MLFLKLMVKDEQSTGAFSLWYISDQEDKITEPQEFIISDERIFKKDFVWIFRNKSEYIGHFPYSNLISEESYNKLFNEYEKLYQINKDKIKYLENILIKYMVSNQASELKLQNKNQKIEELTNQIKELEYKLKLR